MVARSRDVVVYKQTSGALGDLRIQWFTCWQRTGLEALVLDGEDTEVTDYLAGFFRLAGRYAAFMASYRDHYGCGTDGLRLANARSGRVYNTAFLADAPYDSVTGCGTPPGSEQFTLTALVVNAGGFMAWQLDGDQGHNEVRVHDSRGNRLLDSATGRFDHLALTGNRLTWSLNGEERSATLR